ncbi:MAG: hypothetical protein ACI9MR_002836 [Myxococcota bacterium]|jgi:uncharacterized protein involved in type VI secretion and phage assembly
MGYEFGLSRRIYGVVSGVVTDNKHPEGDYRVKVKFGWIRSTDAGDDEDYISSWARVTVLMGGGGRGFYCLPEVDDEVLVSFVHGDIRQPVVIGSMWNAKDAMPVGDAATGNKALTDPQGNDIGIAAAAVDNQAAGGENNARFMTSRSGHTIMFDDTDGKESLQIISKTGHVIVMSDEKDNIAIQDASGEEYIVFDGANKKIILETANGDIDILCKNGILNIEAKEITTTATTKATHEATNEMKMHSKKIIIAADNLIDADAKKIELN